MEVMDSVTVVQQAKQEVSGSICRLVVSAAQTSRTSRCRCGSVGVGMACAGRRVRNSEGLQICWRYPSTPADELPHSSSIRDFDWLATKKLVRNCCMTTSAEIHSGPRILERSAFPDSRCIRRGPSFLLRSARQTKSLDPYSLYSRREDKYREISER